MSEAKKPPAPASAPRHTWLRGLAWGAGAVALACVLLIVAVAIVFSHLDSPRVRRRIQALAHTSAGVDLDYGRVDASLFSGLTLHDLVVASAPPDARLAPALVRIGELKLGWSLGALLGGTLDELRMRGLTATVVQDEQGETSVQRWNARRLSITGPPKPLGPLSHLLETSIPKSPVALKSLVVEDGIAVLLMTRKGQPFERVQAGVFSMSGHARAGQGQLDAAFSAGTATQPLAMRIVRESLDEEGRVAPALERVLELKTSLGIACTAQEVSLAMDVLVARHDLVPSLPEGPLARAHAQVLFDAAHDKLIVRIKQLALVDGAVTASAELELFDKAEPGAMMVVRGAVAHAGLDMLATRLGDLVPKGMRLQRGAFDLTVKEALAPDGRAVGETRIAGVPVIIGEGRELRMDLALVGLQAKTGEAPVRLGSSKVEVRAVGGKVALAARLKALALGPLARPSLELDEASSTADIVPHSDRSFDGDVKLSLGKLRSASRGATSTASDVKLTLGLSGAHLGEDDPLASEADVALQGRIGSVMQVQGKKKTQALGIDIDFKTKLAKRALERTTLRVPIERLALANGTEGPRFALQKAVFSLEVEPMQLDLDTPARIVKALIGFDAGPLSLHAKVDKKEGDVAFELDAYAARLGPFAELLRGSLPADQRASWQDVGLMLRTTGNVHGLDQTATMLIDQQTEASLQRLSLRREGLDFSSRRLDLRLSTEGTMQRHSFDLALDVDAPRLNGRGGEGKQTVALTGSFDLARPRLDLHLTGQGVLGPDGKLDGKADYHVASRLLSFQLDGAFERLGLLGVLIPPAMLGQHRVDFEKLGLKAHAQGRLTSIVARYQPGQPPRFVFAKAPLLALRGTTEVDLTMTALDYGGANELQVTLPALDLHWKSRADDGHLHAETTLYLPSLKARASGHRFAGEKLASSFIVDALGDLATGTATVRAGFTAASLHQDAAPQYPMGEVELKFLARAGAKGSVRIEEASFANPLGGTRLDLRGGLDFGPLDPNLDLRSATTALTRALSGSLIPGRRNLLIEGELSQKVGALSAKGRALGRGTVTMPLRVESGDLSYLRATVGMKFEDVDLDLPDAGLVVTGLNGFIPVAQDLLLDEQGGVTRIFGATSTPYSRLRFSDQQPFTTGNPYLTAQKVELDLSKKGEPGRTLILGPLAGSVRIDRNLIAIDQFEAELSRGKVTGQVLIDGQEGDTQMTFRGAITGLVTDGTDDRLDANAALSFWPTRRLLEGRIEFVRLGRSHLDKMLDLYDPYRADVPANRMRRAMQFGYPKSVRMGFHDGFASLALELGGLAQAVRIDEMRGMPVGPVLERYLVRSPKKEETP